MNETILKFGYPDTLITDYSSWVVLLRPQQATLGTLILASKEPVQAFGDVSAARNSRRLRTTLNSRSPQPSLSTRSIT